MPDVLKIISGNSNRPLAEKISQYVGVPISKAEVSRFSDGEIRVKIDENIRGADLFIIQSTGAPAENLLELLILLDAAKRASARRITAVILLAEALLAASKRIKSSNRFSAGAPVD